MTRTVRHDEAPDGGRAWLCLALAALWVGLHGATLAGAGPDPERWGLRPDAFSLPGALTHFALHVHLPHLAVSLALLGLAVAPLERRWGALFTGGLWLVGVALGGGLYAGLVGGSERPLVGPSALLAGLAAAAAVRFRAEGLPNPGRGSTRRIPALSLVAVWFVGEVVLEVWSDVAGPTRGVHYGVHAALAACGAACALGVGRAGLEGRWLRPRADARRDTESRRALERARAARDAGRVEEACDAVATAFAASPHDARLARAVWELGHAAGRADAVRPGVLRFVAAAWTRGDREGACDAWRAVVEAEPAAPLDLRLRLALAPALDAAGQRRAAALTLRGALADARGLTPGAALRIADLARAIHPATGIEAARRALASEDLDETKRRRIAARIAELEGEPANLEDLDLGAAPPAAPPAGWAAPAPDGASGLDPRDEAPRDPSGDDPGPGRGNDPARDAGDVRAAAAVPEPEDASLDPRALALDPGPDADDALELAGDGPSSYAEDETPFGAVDLGALGAEDAPPEPAVAPPLGAAGPEPGTGSGPSPAAPAPRGRTPVTAAEPSEADDLDPDDIDLEALGDLGDLDALGEVDAPADLAGPPEPRFAATKVIEAVPRTLREDALELASESGGTSRLPLARIEAVSVAGVRELGAKPVVLIDLLLNWSAEDGGPLKIARLRSDRFDPRTLVRAASPTDALRALASALLERSGGRPLPDADGARGRPFAIHDTLAGYEREVLLVGS